MVVGDASCSGWVGAWDGRVAALDWADCGWARTAGDGGIGISVAPTLPIAVLQPFIAAGKVVLRDGGDHGELSTVLSEIIYVGTEELVQDNWWLSLPQLRH